MDNAVLVTLNYNDAKNSIKVAENAVAADFIKHAVIVDNCSPDGSYDILKEAETENITVIKSDKNGGFAYGNNVGIRYVLSHFNPNAVFLINSDIIVDEKTLRACMDFLKNNREYGVVSPIMLDKNGNYDGGFWNYPTYIHELMYCFWIYRKFDIFYNMPKPDKSVTDVDAVRGSFMCFRGEVLERIGGFDENTFLYNEENNICKMLNAAGYKAAVLADYSYLHNHRDGAQKPKAANIKMRFESGYYYILKNYKTSAFERCVLRLCMKYGILEQKAIDKVKEIVGGNTTKR